MQHRKSMIGLAAALAIALSAASPAVAANWHGHGGGWHGHGGGWHGGGGGWHGGGWHRGAGWGGAAAGFAAGALIGSAAAAAPYGYGYGYGPYAYDGGYYGDDAYAAEPATTDDGSDQYCAQRYRSYDPSSGTFLGYDGMRHPCP